MLASVSSVALTVTFVAAALFILCFILMALSVFFFGNPYMTMKFKNLSVFPALVAIHAFLVFVVTRVIMLFVG